MRHALIAETIGKSFRHRNSDIAPTFRAWLESGLFRNRSEKRFWALRDVSLRVAPGEMVGVIGRNGSGKSTLLRLLGGVMQPDRGSVAASDPVRGLLQLNTGMHPDLSGRENVLINGVLCGLLKSEVQERMSDIIAFADLHDHIEQPVRTYSSGMRLRLGFAIAVHVDPKILLIDEVLAVGDLAFQGKCLARISAFKKAGCAIVLISHDMHQIREFCDRAIWLDAGHVCAEGLPDAVVEAYETAAHSAAANEAAKAEPLEGPNRFGTKEVVIGDVRLMDASGAAIGTIAQGDAMTVRFRLTPAEPTQVQISVSIADASRRLCFDANSETDQIEIPEVASGLSLSISFARLDLSPGTYFVSVGVWHRDWSKAYDMHMDAYSFEITGGPKLLGVLAPPRRWRATPD
ncbi:ABC transporter ATP-binding protein [Silicimonas algicola]|uniref:Lipopolysaccharide transport system ATP-binding protein n=1 Tax=Silicimonas algicola TaxID=1826607 RepID=A0A316G8E1_9RHOB|nr:ABC transporter ATP-binding protein [Silicimonas algicola]AZQ67210.1 ABC transporter ATP-binding protein [Silicimonas algicola]PWK56872.1 lipopolysaccharide transport system ATP-binding protein [Silicimonas algicola]